MHKLFYICLFLLGMFIQNDVVFAQTQLEMNQESCNDFAQTDLELNKYYKMVLNTYKNDPLFISKFIISQRKWLVFRDAYLESIYPNTQKNFYGSVNPMCRCTALTDVTLVRLKQIKMWINGIEEGNVCRGSIKV
ncbi:MAG TPA: DUF1311 domain-containing protein [Legionella sp.]|nr:DUF1311 domain-containing protein [Legionella sp.]